MTGMLAEAALAGGVKTLAIVDDAYDAPDGQEISENAFNQFVRALEDAPAIMAEFVALSALTEGDLDDWEDFIGNGALIEELWELSVGVRPVPMSVDASAALVLLFADIQADRISKLLQLKPLEDLIKDFPDVALMKLGAETNPETVATADVVFLDLFLSTDIPPFPKAGTTPKSALDRAKERALTYLTAVRSVTADDLSATSPAFILISSSGSNQIGANFRKRAGQAAARFRFVSKQSIEKSEPQGLLAIADILSTCQASALVEPMRKAWPEAVAAASAWVNERLENLDIADFGRLYALSLQQEGQPVEDYVKELISGALAEQVACAFSERRPAKAGRSPFEVMPGNFFNPPSNAFADLYGATRITKDRGYRGLEGMDPLSGDLFLDGAMPKSKSTSLEGRTIQAVMSPICDLVGRNGKAPAAKSALMLHGVLRSTTFKHDGASQALSVGGRFYEIEWQWKHPQALSLSVLKQNLASAETTWLGRLKSEHFLALQADYLGSFGRVGLLKAPGIFETLSGSINIRENGTITQVGNLFTARNRFVFLSPDKTKTFPKQPLFFTGQFIEELVVRLNAIAADADRPVASRQKAKGLLERVESHVFGLLKRQAASAHQINDYLKVDLVEDRGAPVPDSANGVIHIKLWKN